MADEPAHDPMQEVYFIGGILVILLILWIANGGPARSDLRGIFLAPPPPLGSGEAYGPEFGDEESSATDTTQGQTYTQQIEVRAEPDPRAYNY